MNIKRQSKIGILFIGAERFMELGDATKHGTYAERKVIECEEYLKAFEGKADVLASNIVCTREAAEEWADKFYNAEVIKKPFIVVIHFC